jgi:two-component system, cell cycle response regulator DivK
MQHVKYNHFIAWNIMHQDGRRTVIVSVFDDSIGITCCKDEYNGIHYRPNKKGTARGSFIFRLAGAKEEYYYFLRLRMPSRILLVEDNEMNRDMLSRRLQHRGYVVSVAEDGRQGLEMATKLLPDLILLDMSLPEMDGWEAASRLKSEKITQHIPIIALTAHAMADDRERALAAGCNEYDTKPIEFQRLLDKMGKLLSPQKHPH